MAVRAVPTINVDYGGSRGTHDQCRLWRFARYPWSTSILGISAVDVELWRFVRYPRSMSIMVVRAVSTVNVDYRDIHGQRRSCDNVNHEALVPEARRIPEARQIGCATHP
jgi:hypothetical protein